MASPTINIHSFDEFRLIDPSDMIDCITQTFHWDCNETNPNSVAQRFRKHFQHFMIGLNDKYNHEDNQKAWRSIHLILSELLYQFAVKTNPSVYIYDHQKQFCKQLSLFLKIGNSHHDYFTAQIMGSRNKKIKKR